MVSPGWWSPWNGGHPRTVVTPGWFPQDRVVPKMVVTPEWWCPQDSGVPGAVLSPGWCRAGQDVLCGARAAGAADSATAPRVSCLGGTRGATGAAGPGGGFLPGAPPRLRWVPPGGQWDRQGSGSSHVAVPMSCQSPCPLLPGPGAIGVSPWRKSRGRSVRVCRGWRGEGSRAESAEALPSRPPAPRGAGGSAEPGIVRCRLPVPAVPSPAPPAPADGSS